MSFPISISWILSSEIPGQKYMIPHTTPQKANYNYFQAFHKEPH